MVLHLDVGREKSVKALEKAMVEEHMILLCSQSEVNIEEPTQEDIYQNRNDGQGQTDAEASERYDSCTR